MPRRRTRKLSTSLFIPGLILCLLTGLGGWLVYSIPQQAMKIFGPPSQGLSFSQRLMYSYQLLSNQAKMTQPGQSEGDSRPFEIQLGESVSSIASRLQAEGLIPDSEIFSAYLVYSGLDTELQAGEYQLNSRMAPLEIARQLIDPTPGKVTFGVLPGWRLEEIAATLPTSGLSITPEAFIDEAHNLNLAPSLKAQLPETASLEGFLFPGEYQFQRTLSAGEMLLEMVEQFNQKVNPEIRSGFETQGLTLYQAVILASIIQREAVVKAEQPIIASVFYNRLANGMKLESDPTAQYALGWNAEQHTWWTNPLSKNDLEFDSPYNTYVYGGLPPGPISNPGLSALQAVASPAKTHYFFFRAKCDGSGMHNFSESFDEHVQNACP